MTEYVTVNGHSIPKMNVGQIVALVDEIDARKRARLMADLDAVNADNEQRIAELKQHDRYRQQTLDLANHALSLSGAYEIVNQALSAMPGKIAVDDLNLDLPRGLARLACEIIGLDYDYLTAPDDRSDPTSSPSPSAETG